MNEFALNQSEEGDAKAQFATFFPEKCTRKDNRLLCMPRYRFVIKPGDSVLDWDYILIRVFTVSFYLA